MPVLLQICAVIVTIAIAAIAAATIHSSNRLVKSLDELKLLTQDVEQLVDQARHTIQAGQQVIGTAREVVLPLRRVAERFEGVGDRAASLSEAVLAELERPVFNVVAFTRGVRSGAAYFFDRLNVRFKQGRQTADGGFQHE
jgi:hypothetical protein